jgi:glyoxylase-like metal-dependent hydrolase (beta-lactamase superfamily II)
MKRWSTFSGIQLVKVISFRSHVYLVKTENHTILVDSGIKSIRKLLERRLDQLGVKQIDFLVLTHSHFDHAGNAAWIQSTYGAKVIIHKKEAEALASGYADLPLGLLWFTRLPMKILGKRLAPNLSSEPCQPDISMDERFDLRDTGSTVFVLHTPGHSPGSVSVVIDGEVALTGDAMFGIFPGSVFPPFGQDELQMILSWKKLLDTGCRLFLPSHGSGNSRELVQKCYDKRKTAL